VYDIITTGSALVDIFVDTGLKEVKSSKRRKLIAYPAGAKIAVNDLRFSIGGGGTNTGVAFSRLGLKTAYLGKLGNDHSAEKILGLLKKEKVNFIGKQEECISGHSVVLDSFEHHRTILTFKGPSDRLKISDIDLNKLKTKWIYFASAMDETFKTQEKLADFAKKKDIKIAFNPSEYEVKQGARYLKKILTKTDVLILNRDEAGILTKKQDIKKILFGLIRLGPEIVCVTDGTNMIYAYDGVEIFTLKPHKIKLAETTGAGDAFASGFIAGLVKGKDIPFAMKLGLANSESVIQHYGAKNRLLKWDEVLKKIG